MVCLFIASVSLSLLNELKTNFSCDNMNQNVCVFNHFFGLCSFSALEPSNKYVCKVRNREVQRRNLTFMFARPAFFYSFG